MHAGKARTAKTGGKRRAEAPLASQGWGFYRAADDAKTKTVRKRSPDG